MQLMLSDSASAMSKASPDTFPSPNERQKLDRDLHTLCIATFHLCVIRKQKAKTLIVWWGWGKDIYKFPLAWPLGFTSQ